MIDQSSDAIPSQRIWYEQGLSYISRINSREAGISKNKILDVLAKEVHMAESNVRKRIAYVNLLNCFEKMCPSILQAVLSGEIYISVARASAISHLSTTTIKSILTRALAGDKTAIPSVKVRAKPQQKKNTANRNELSVSQASIKDTPAYDPDALVASLIYTVPSWISTIERTFMRADFSEISYVAQHKLIYILRELTSTTNTVISILSEENNR